MSLGFGWNILSADVSEMIFYPEADFTEGIFHFNYQGDRNKNYGFMFEKGFDVERIVYVRPSSHRVEKLKDGTVKVSFANTNRYSYLQRAYRDDFLVSDEKGIVKILLSGGDCKGSADCVTAENILTVYVPKGYGVRSYQGLDQDLKPLKNSQWQRKGNAFTLIAREVKGACIMMELERLRPGQAPLHAALPPTRIVDAAPKASKPAVEKSVAPTETAALAAASTVSADVAKTPETAAPKIEAVAEKAAEKPAAIAASVEPSVSKPAVSGEQPAAYFRNFQLFENQAVVALSSKGKERLSEWAEQFKAQGYRSVVIKGYTDDIPPKRLKHLYDTNEILSESRAKVVADYLASLGIDASRIGVSGLGALNPVAPNDTEEGRSKNRRIEFVLSR